MRRKGYVYLILFIILGLGAKYTVNTFIERYGEGRIEIQLQGESKVGYEQIRLNGYYKELGGIPLIKQDVMIKSDVTRQVQAMGTEEIFLQADSLILRRGSFFSQQAVDEKRNVVVISDELAQSLFHSYNAVGNRCNINGLPFEVIGIYQKYNSFLDRMIDDTIERIYIPITNKLIEEQFIDEMICLTSMVDTNQLRLVGVDEENSIINNQTNIRQRINNYIKIPWFILGILYISLIIKKLLIINKKYYNLLKKCHQQYYFTQLVKTKYKQIGCCCLWNLFYIGEIILIFYMIKFKLYIPAEKLPVENIFDVSFYIQSLWKQIAFNNYIYKLNINNFYAAYQKIKVILMVVTVLQAVCIYRIYEFIYKKAKFENKELIK